MSKPSRAVLGAIVVALCAVCSARRRCRAPRQRDCRTGDELPARQQGRADQARHLSAVRQHALPARQRQDRVRPRADAEPPELPQEQRHARRQRPHDPHLAYRGRDPVVADRPLSGSHRPGGLELVRLLQADRRAAVHELVQVLDEHRRRHEQHAAEHGRRRRPDDSCSVAHVHARGLQRRRRVGREHRAREQLGHPGGDVATVYGTSSPEAAEPRGPAHGRLRRHRDPLREGQRTVRAGPNAKPDQATTVPGSDEGYKALLGAKYVNPAITAATAA